MSLTLMYITNNPQIASIAQKAGVDRIWIDMEYIGKNLRQGGMDTVQNHHTIDDIKKLRPFITKSELLVRINPIHDFSNDYISSREEIEETINAGADVIMLPYFKTPEEVAYFSSCIQGRSKTQILIETAEAVKNLDAILSVKGIDEVHIGLNDLHLAYKKKFMFELLSDGTVDRICEKVKSSGKKFGFGGIARVGYGMLPAEYVIAEHYRIGSTAAILSRGFCNANKVENPFEIEKDFIEGVKKIRDKEKEVEKFTDRQREENRKVVSEIVSKIVANQRKVDDKNV